MYWMRKRTARPKVNARPGGTRGRRETLDINSDEAFRADIRRGIREIQRGKTVSYEAVFGERPRRNRDPR